MDSVAWISWVPLTVFVVLLTLAELTSIVTDAGYRLRRELRADGRATLESLLAMERRGVRVRQSIVTTEASVLRPAMIRLHLAFWAFVLVVAVVAFVLSWPWWIAAVVIGIAVAIQIVDFRGLLGLRRPGVAAAADHSVARSTLGIGSALMIIGAVLLLGWGLDPKMSTGEMGIRIAAAGSAIPVLYLAIWVRRLADRIGSVVDAPPRFGEDAARSDVLLLRSFKDDELRIRAADPVIGRLALLLGNRVRFEEYIASLFSHERRLIAIGKPGEALPALGAVRTYFADDEWQEAIDATARRVGAIVMIAAGTGGFEWELSLLRRTGHLSKTLILVPPIGPGASMTRIQDLFARLGLSTLPSFESPEWEEWGFTFLFALTAIGFDPDGEPVYHLAMGRDWAGYAVTTVRALSYLSGRSIPPAPGEIARILEAGA